ncbi:hypothetical protein [Paenibacillus sp. WLX2291]|uniref:hypothetical protein n=1 Tax=Paenibacillus sp. WLX2291 TaxID=3296934 RepID=UPI003983F10A
MGLIKSIIKQVMNSKSSKKHSHRSYSSSDRYRRGGHHNQYNHNHYKRRGKGSSYSSS